MNGNQEDIDAMEPALELWLDDSRSAVASVRCEGTLNKQLGAPFWQLLRPRWHGTPYGRGLTSALSTLKTSKVSMP